MNIFLHELRTYRKTVLIWTLSLSALSVLYVFLYNAVLPDIDSFKIVMNSMPDVVKKMLSIYVDSIADLEGFYSFAFAYIILCGAIQAMNLGLSLISKEVRDKTADFLLTKPVSRASILTAKLAAGLVFLVFTNAAFIGLTLLSTVTVATVFSTKLLLMICVTMFYIQLIFFALGVVVSVISNKIKSVISVSLSTVFGFFIVSMLGAVIGDEAVRYISPFQYFDLPYIVQNASYETRFAVVGAVFFALAILASYGIYMKKDIHSV